MGDGGGRGEWAGEAAVTSSPSACVTEAGWEPPLDTHSTLRVGDAGLLSCAAGRRAEGLLLCTVTPEHMPGYKKNVG